MKPHQHVDGIDPSVVEGIARLASAIEPSDLDLVEPPADLWADIEAALAVDDTVSHRAPKVPPGRVSGTATVIEYWIDGNDVFTTVGQDWDQFATDNGAPGLGPSSSGRTLWTYFDRDDVRDLWKLLVARVRADHKQVRVPLRCDAAHARRWFELTVTPKADTGVHFRCELTFEEPREPVLLLDTDRRPNTDAEPVVVCSWCGRGRSGSTWLDIEELVHSERLLEQTSLPPISHGICNPCRDDMSAELLVADGVEAER